MHEFRMAGRPKPQGSMVSHGGRIHHPAGTLRYRDTLVTRLREWWGGRPALDGPLTLIEEYGIPRPPSHLRVSGQPRAAAPEQPVSPPDLDKLERLTGDALTLAGVITDDARIVARTSRKVWAPEPGYVWLRIGGGDE